MFFWAKMWGSGEAYNQRDRIIDSKVVSSEQLADMYLMYKDHKEGRATRPVVTGCNSNTRGMSNNVSDLLESVNKANLEPYEVVSGEDMLARIEKYNKKAEEIIQEGRERLSEKMKCKKIDGMRRLARCDKLWKKKREEARRAANGEEQQQEHEDEDQGHGHECKDDKNEEIMKYRTHQYNE